MAGCIGTYYYDGTDFSGSTSIYTTQQLTTVAADGWYSLNGVSRRMLNGVLEQPLACVGCASPCSVTPSATNAIFLSATVPSHHHTFGRNILKE